MNMPPRSQHRRRLLLRCGAAALSGAVPAWAGAKDKPRPPAPPPTAAAEPTVATAPPSAAPTPAPGEPAVAANGKGATLTVLVTGEGKPVAQAEVKFEMAKAVETLRLTDAQGTASLSAAAAGKVTVRVIAKGWDSHREDTVLAPGQAGMLKVALRREPGKGAAPRR